MKTQGSTPLVCWPTCALRSSTTPYLLPWLSSTTTTSTSKLSHLSCFTLLTISYSFSWKRMKCREWTLRFVLELFCGLYLGDLECLAPVYIYPYTHYTAISKWMPQWIMPTLAVILNLFCICVCIFFSARLLENTVGLNLFWNGYLGTEPSLVSLESILCLRDNIGYCMRKGKFIKISNVPLNYIAG